MIIRMALFGLVWLLRVRGAACTCIACRRGRVVAGVVAAADDHDARAACDGDDTACPEAVSTVVPPPSSATVRTPVRNIAAVDVIDADVIAGTASMNLSSEIAVQTCDVTVQTEFLDDDELNASHELSSLDIKDTELLAANPSRSAKTSPRAIFESNLPLSHAYKKDDEDDKESIWECEDVTLYRDSLGLGFSITGGTGGNQMGSSSDGEVRITRIADDGSAAKNGHLKLDDVILQVNGVSVVGAPHAMAVETLQKAGNSVTLRVRRARGVRHVSLTRGIWTGSTGVGFGLGVAGGRDCPRRRGDPGVYVTHVAPQIAHKLTPGDRILAVRDELYGERLLLNVTHAEAVDVLHSASDNITLVVTPVSREPGSHFLPSPMNIDAAVTKSDRMNSQRSQATSCSALHELVETEEILDIPRYIRVVKLQRSGSRLGMDIMGGGGCEDGIWQQEGEMVPSVGVFVSRCAPGGAAEGQLHRGDRILSVDGQDLTTASHEQAAAALKSTGTLVVIEAQYQPEEYSRLRAKIRALNIKAGEQSLYNR